MIPVKAVKTVRSKEEPYVRPTPPDPNELRARVAALKASNEALARSLGNSKTGRFSSLGASERAIPVAQLASTIRGHNEARVERANWSEEQEYARLEILTACEDVQANIEHTRSEGKADGFHDGMSMFASAVSEFLTAIAAKSMPKRQDALRAMRESVAAMDQYRVGPRQ